VRVRLNVFVAPRVTETRKGERLIMFAEFFLGLPNGLKAIIGLSIFWGPIFFWAHWSMPIGRFGYSYPDNDERVLDWKKRRERWGYPVDSDKGRWVVPFVFFAVYGTAYLLFGE